MCAWAFCAASTAPSSVRLTRTYDPAVIGGGPGLLFGVFVAPAANEGADAAVMTRHTTANTQKRLIPGPTCLGLQSVAGPLQSFRETFREVPDLRSNAFVRGFAFPDGVVDVGVFDRLRALALSLRRFEPRHSLCIG